MPSAVGPRVVLGRTAFTGQLAGRVMRYISAVFFAVFLAFALQATAHAYLDPGTGSFILMMLISGVVGAAYAVKLYWRKIIDYFAGRRSQESGPGEQDSDDQA